MWALPEEMRAPVYATPGSFSTYQTIRNAVTVLYLGRRMFNSGADLQYLLMDIDGQPGCAEVWQTRPLC